MIRPLIRVTAAAAVLLSPHTAPGIAEFPPEIIPAAAPWSFSYAAPSGNAVIRIPDDLARIEALPEEAESAVRAEIARYEANRDYVRGLARHFFGRSDLDHVRILADYEHSMRVAAISVSFEDATGIDPLWRHRPLINALPAYTRLVVRTPEKLAPAVRQALANSVPSRPFSVVPARRRSPNALSTSVSRSSRWIRDTFVVAHDARNGDTALLLPPAYTRLEDLANNDLANFERDRHWADRTIRIPAFVRGGNLHATLAGGRHLLFVGEREWTYHDEAFMVTTRHRSPGDLLSTVLKKLAGPSELVVLPNSDHLFHIDQVVAFPRPGIAAIIVALDAEKLSASDRRVIDATLETVRNKGFQVVRVPTTADRIARFRSPVNAVAYTNQRTRRPSLLAPLFPDERVSVNGATRSLNELIRAAYEGIGVDVQFVEDRFSDRQGNTRCALLALE